jgi:hypothetical protein
MTTLTVGAGKQYSTIAAAVAASRDGDVVQVQAGTYENDNATINTKITLEGVGGMVHLVATEPPTDGKAIITTNTDVTIRNFEFSGAAVADGNGAGIRYQEGDLVVENSYFHDNQDGLLAAGSSDGTITIRNSEFSHNGTGDGYTHNLYVGQIAKLTVEDSYFHDAVVGHEIKSRAEETIITNSRIVDGDDGTGSYSIDLPNGGAATITGNVIEQGAKSDSPHVIHYGGEGSAYDGSSLTISDNVVVNDLGSASARLLVNETSVTAEVSDNTVFGLTAGQIATGSAEVWGIVTLAARPVLDLSQTWASDASGTTTGEDAGNTTSADATGSYTDASALVGDAIATAASSGTAAAEAGATETSAATSSSTGGTDTAATSDASGLNTDGATASDGAWKFTSDGNTSGQLLHPDLALTTSGTSGGKAMPTGDGSDTAYPEPLAGSGAWQWVDVPDASVDSMHLTVHHFDPWG